MQARSHWVLPCWRTSFTPTCLVHVDLYMGSIRSLQFYGNDLLNDRCKCDRRKNSISAIVDLIVLRSLRSLNFGNHWSQGSQRSLCSDLYDHWDHIETRLEWIMCLGVVLVCRKVLSIIFQPEERTFRSHSDVRRWLFLLIIAFSELSWWNSSYMRFARYANFLELMLPKASFFSGALPGRSFHCTWTGSRNKTTLDRPRGTKSTSLTATD